MSDKVLSETECKIIQAQVERRARYRKEFLKKRTDPCKHSMESGVVFDESLQRWLSMKACQVEHFHANQRTIGMALGAVGSMVVYGYFIHRHRSQIEQDIRCGKLRPRDRMFKFH